MLTERHPSIDAWTTNYRGQRFTLTPTGQLHPTERPTMSTQWRGDTYTLTPNGQLLKEATMPRSITTASLVEQAKQDLLAPPTRNIDRIVSEEMHALVLRREAHRLAQEQEGTNDRP